MRTAIMAGTSAVVLLLLISAALPVSAQTPAVEVAITDPDTSVDYETLPQSLAFNGTVNVTYPPPPIPRTQVTVILEATASPDVPIQLIPSEFNFNDTGNGTFVMIVDIAQTLDPTTTEILVTVSADLLVSGFTYENADSDSVTIAIAPDDTTNGTGGGGGSGGSGGDGGGSGGGGGDDGGGTNGTGDDGGPLALLQDTQTLSILLGVIVVVGVIALISMRSKGAAKSGGPKRRGSSPRRPARGGRRGSGQRSRRAARDRYDDEDDEDDDEYLEGEELDDDDEFYDEDY